MYNTLKKHQKKVMAVFMVGLMIAFALPNFIGQGGSGRVDHSIGSVNNADLSSAKVQAAIREWDFLSHNVLVRSTVRDQSQPEGIREDTDSIVAVELGFSSRDTRGLPRQMKDNPEMYALLQEEAHQMGIVVTPEMAQARLSNTVLTTEASSEIEYTTNAVRNLLMVKAAFDQAAATDHISKTRRDHELSKRQRLGLNLVEFRGSDYDSVVPYNFEPKQMQEQFDKYKNTLAEGNLDNHWGFGYKVPNQVKIEYLEVEDSKVRQAVQAQITPLELIKQYKDNQTQYPTSAPSKPEDPLNPTSTPTSAPTTGATTNATTAATTKATTLATTMATTAPASQPAPLTYAFYRDRVRTDLEEKLTADLKTKIIEEITTTMTADYLSFSKATSGKVGEHPASMPSDVAATASTTLVGAPYGSVAYLTQLAMRIQEKYKVLPAMQTVGSLKNAKDLAALPGIGKSALFLEGTRESVPFGRFATLYVDAFVTDSLRSMARLSRTPLMELYQPSPVLAADHNQYIFRIVEGLVAHAPASLDEVRSDIVVDLRRQRQYELALQDAQRLLAKARSSRLAPVAMAENRDIIATSLFTRDDPSFFEQYPQYRPSIQSHLPAEYPLSDALTASEFLRQSYDLLTTEGSADPQHPVGLIELNESAVNRVLVAELAGVQPDWPASLTPAIQMRTQSKMLYDDRADLRDRWFRFDALSKRMNYKPAAVKKSGVAPAPAPVSDDLD